MGQVLLIEIIDEASDYTTEILNNYVCGIDLNRLEILTRYWATRQRRPLTFPTTRTTYRATPPTVSAGSLNHCEEEFWERTKRNPRACLNIRTRSSIAHNYN